MAINPPPSDERHISNKSGLPWKSVGAGAVTALIAVGAFQMLAPSADSQETHLVLSDSIIEPVEIVVRQPRQSDTPDTPAPAAVPVRKQPAARPETTQPVEPPPRAGREIQRKLVETVRSYSACYQAGLANDPSIEGTVTVRFRIEEDGTVSTAEVVESDLQSVMVENCLCQAIRSWRFQAGHVADDFQLDFPFIQD